MARKLWEGVPSAREIHPANYSGKSMKLPKFLNFKKSRANTKMRGGFITPKPINSPHDLFNQVGDSFKGKVTPEGLHRHVNNFVGELKGRKKDHEFKEIESPDHDFISDNVGKIVSGVTDALVARLTQKKGPRTGNMGAAPTEYHTKVVTGAPNPKVFRTLAKQNGTVKRWLFDSDINTRNYGMNRSEFSHSYGYNCRGLFCPPTLSYVHISDLISTGQIQSTDNRSQGLEKEKAQLCYRNVESQFKIHNDNAYLAGNFRIHLIKPNLKETATSLTAPQSVIEGLHNVFVGNAQSGDAGASIHGIPDAFLFRNAPLKKVIGANSTPVFPFENAEALQWTTQVSNKTSYTSSTAFRDSFKIVKTFSRKLLPNETWYFSHKHLLGSGVDIFSLVNYISSSEWTRFFPVGYMYLIEANGIPVQAVNFETANGLYKTLGTSNGSYSVEYRKGISFIQHPLDSISGLSDAGVVDTRPLIRSWQTIYRGPKGNASQEKFTLPENIVDREEDLASGKTFIPITTTEIIASNKSKSGVSGSN